MSLRFASTPVTLFPQPRRRAVDKFYRYLYGLIYYLDIKAILSFVYFVIQQNLVFQNGLIIDLGFRLLLAKKVMVIFPREIFDSYNDTMTNVYV